MATLEPPSEKPQLEYQEQQQQQKGVPKPHWIVPERGCGFKPIGTYATQLYPQHSPYATNKMLVPLHSTYSLPIRRHGCVDTLLDRGTVRGMRLHEYWADVRPSYFAEC